MLLKAQILPPPLNQNPINTFNSFVFLYVQLLEPLQQRLKFLLQRYPLKTLSQEPGVKTELLSIIECLCGVGLVSKASLVHNFIVFFQPVLVTLVEVFDAFSNCQEVMVIILELFSIIAENYITFLNEVTT